MSKKLVILTTHFGTNFSGGSSATCEIFSRIESHFSEIIVIGTQLGQHPFQNLKFIPYRNWTEARQLLKERNGSESIFYGDFYNAVIFTTLKIPFYFTYHDNWPELRHTSLKNRFRSIYYSTIYKRIFKHAELVFTVSAFRIPYIKRYNKNVCLVRNGINSKRPEKVYNKKKDVLMVGAIDDRKYRLAIKLFERMDRRDNISIEIYGNELDKKIGRALSKFPFVKLRGFSPEIPYSNYKLLLHTSVMENLSMVICEAIYNGIPVLAFDVGGSKEVVTPGNGVLVPPYQINMMAESLYKLMSNGAMDGTDTGILKEYSWEKASSKYLEYLSA